MSSELNTLVMVPLDSPSDFQSTIDIMAVKVNQFEDALLRLVFQKNIRDEIPPSDYLSDKIEKEKKSRIIALLQPQLAGKGIHLRSLLGLIQLAKLANEQTQGQPFTEKACEAFNQANRANRVALGFLRIGLGGTTGLAGVPFLGAIPKIADWIQSSAQNNSIYVMSSIGVAVLANIINFIATGSVPYWQANAALEAKTLEAQIKLFYERMANTLIQLNKIQPEIAKAIAEKIDIKILNKAMSGFFPVEDETSLYNRLTDRCFTYFNCNKKKKRQEKNELINHCCTLLKHAKKSVLSGDAPPLSAPQSIRVEYFLTNYSESLAFRGPKNGKVENV